MSPPSPSSDIVGAGPPVDGLVMRAATEEDVDGIIAVETNAFGVADGPGIHAALEEAGGPANWAVVVDAQGRLVSASALLDLTLDIDGTPVRAGQVEWVATYPEHQRRGLVRAQFERHHRLAAERGHLVTVIAGIPYLYRRLGYGYGLDYPTIYTFDNVAAGRGDQVAAVRRADDIVVRDADVGDIAAMLDLEHTRAADGVKGRRDERYFARRLAAARGDRSRHERLVVAEHEGRVVGWLGGKLDDEEDMRLHCKPGAAASADATDALVGFMIEAARQREVTFIADGATGSVYGARLAELGSPIELYAGYYTRTPDPVALLDALRPVLGARLRSSPDHAEASGTLEVSLYREGVAIDYDRGQVTEVRPIDGVEDPMAHLGVGVAPDWFGALVLGRWGATTLARRVDDVILGRHGPIMETLFPARPSDIAADV